MQYIFIIAAFHALFFAVLLFQKKVRALHDHLLIVWLIYLGLYTGVYALFFDTLYENSPLLAAGFISLLLLHGPFLYFYIKSLTEKSYKVKQSAFLHLLPFMLFNLYLLGSSFYSGYSASIRMGYVEAHINPPLLFLLFLGITALSGPVYFVYSLQLIKKHDIQIFKNFSSYETINLDWLRKLVFVFGTIWVVLISFATIHHGFSLFSMHFCTDGLFLSLSLFIILTGYFGLKQRDIFSYYLSEGKAKEQKGNKPTETYLPDADSQQYLQQLDTYMQNRKPFLNPKLTLPQLAAKVDIPYYTLSQVINRSGIHFFDYVNQYRVEEVKKRMQDPDFKNYTLLGIALESGFNSKSAFNRVFKNITGITPTQYKKSTFRIK